MTSLFCFGPLRRNRRIEVEPSNHSSTPESSVYPPVSKTNVVSLDGPTVHPDTFKMYCSYEPAELKQATRAFVPAVSSLDAWMDPLEQPPADPRKGIHSLPLELVRLIIIHLLHDPAQPGSFRKYWLLPLASTSKGFRAVSTEFLFWSMDLFEASFGLRHRVLPSDMTLSLFHDLICPGVPTFIRTGVRRLLIRDRDNTALRAELGMVHLSSILGWVESVRSIHFDGRFFYHPHPPVTLDVPPASRLNETLVNLTFLDCDPRSPLFRCFLTSQRWRNLTRIEYSDLADHRSFSTPDHSSPFASFESLTEPVFPHLSIFCFTHGYQLPGPFGQVLNFITLHRTTLDRLSIISHVGGQDDFNFNFTTYRDGWNTQTQPECMRALWKCLPALHRLRLLDLDVSVAHTSFAPTHIVRLPSLRALNLRNESAWQYLQPFPSGQGVSETHPITSFYNHIPAPSIAYTHGSPALERSGMPSTSTRRRTTSAKRWFEQASQLLHVRNFTHSDVIEGTHIWVSLDSGGVRDVREVDEKEKKLVIGQAGGFSVREDAELNDRFI